MSQWVKRLWMGEEPLFRVVSALLLPVEGAYRSAVIVRGWAYDRGLLKSQAAKIPTLAVGNLTVGGTGKTPVTAWLARELQARGRKPAVVLRGYGEDEVEVHRVLNPTVNIHVSANRLAAVQWVEREGSDCVVLDDAFQHRALRANANVVLVAVEDWVDRPKLLPRGPWREPLEALGRATLVVVTRKVCSPDEALRVRERLAELQPALPQAQAHIGLAGLARYHAAGGRLGETVATRGFSCPLVVAGVAKPDTVSAQLAASGVSFERSQTFADHHRYRDVDIARIADDALGGPVVMTLKDAVKLGRVLPPEIEIYVPLQQIVWEVGGEEIECLMANLMGHTTAIEAGEG